MARIRRVEKGIFVWLKSDGTPTKTLWVHVSIGFKVVQRSAKTDSIQKARQFRTQLMADAQRTGTVVPARQIVASLLDALLGHYERNKKASLRTIRGHVSRLTAALGHLRVTDPDFADRVGEAQDAWIKAGIEKVTINRYCETLRVAVRMWARKRQRPVPWVPMLDAPSGRRARYIPPADQVLLTEHLPTHLADILDLATMCGVRKGQLVRTKREYVNADLKAIEWPAEETKQRRPHFLPLDDRGWRLVEPRLRDTRPWCPYLFHGERCSPTRTPSRAYGCVGWFAKAWATAVRNAGLSDVRFHDTRRTAATRLRAEGVDEATAMKITGHQTSYIFRQYDLGDIEQVRAAMARVSEQAEQRAKERARFRK